MNDFKVKVLGSGSAVPTLLRSASAFLVDVGSKRILLDCGTGTVRRLSEYGIDLQSIDVLFNSHFHTDHFGDSEAIVHMRWIDDFGNGREGKRLLWIGPEGTKKNFEKLRSIFWPEPNETYDIDFKEGPQNLKIGDISITTFPIVHVPWFKSVGIKIEYKGKILAYTGDVGSKQNLVELEQNVRSADLLMAEAGYPTPTPNHFTLEQIEQVKNKANVKKVLVFHIRAKDIKRIEDYCKKTEGFIVGEDGLSITV